VLGREKLWTVVAACFRAVLVVVASSRLLVRCPSPSRSRLATVRGLAARAARFLVLPFVAGVAGGTPAGARSSAVTNTHHSRFSW
jgi:hypothetical protein